MSSTELVTLSAQLPTGAPPSQGPSHARSASSPADTPSVASRASIRAANHGDGDDPGESHQLAPVDGGIAAWRLLAVAFVFETLLWGFPLSFGIFQDYYSSIPEFANNPWISVVGTIASGLGYVGAPFIMPFVQRDQRRRTHMICIGWVICLGGLVGGSFAKTLEVLILTQGVAYGVGFLILYYPIIIIVNEYWITRRGMAYGILCGASGLSGAIMPFIVHALLVNYGYQTTLRAVAVGLALCTGPLIPFLQGRLPVSDRRVTPRTDWSFFKNPLFWVYSISNLLQGFGYFFPALYLPSFATSMDLGAQSGPLLLAVMSVAQVVGQFTFGYLSDRKAGIDILACASTLVAAAVSLTMWRLADSLALLIGFAILYGLFATGFTAVWARMSSAITDDVTSGPIVFGLLNFGKGIGNVLAGPIGGLLVRGKSDLSTIQSGPMTPSSYRWVIIFTGCCMLGSACVIGLRHLKQAVPSFLIPKSNAGAFLESRS